MCVHDGVITLVSWDLKRVKGETVILGRFNCFLFLFFKKKKSGILVDLWNILFYRNPFSEFVNAFQHRISSSGFTESQPFSFHFWNLDWDVATLFFFCCCCFEEELDTGFMVKSTLAVIDIFQKVVFYVIAFAGFQWILEDDTLSGSS